MRKGKIHNKNIYNSQYANITQTSIEFYITYHYIHIDFMMFMLNNIAIPKLIKIVLYTFGSKK